MNAFNTHSACPTAEYPNAVPGTYIVQPPAPTVGELVAAFAEAADAVVIAPEEQKPALKLAREARRQEWFRAAYEEQRRGLCHIQR